MKGPDFFSSKQDDDTIVLDFGFRAVKVEYYWVCLSFLIADGDFLFSLMYFVFSLQGLFQNPAFYSLHLLDVVQRFKALKTVIRSVTENLKSLLLTAMLGMILVFIYAAVAF